MRREGREVLPLWSRQNRKENRPEQAMGAGTTGEVIQGREVLRLSAWGPREGGTQEPSQSSYKPA